VKRLIVCGFVGAISLWGAVSDAAVLFEHPLPSFDNRNAWCSGCNGNCQIWDQFRLAESSTITQIDATLYFPLGLTGPIEYSIWDVTRATQLFEETFFPADLAMSNIKWDYARDVSASITGLSLPAGSYTLSIYGTNVSENFGWYPTDATVDGLSYQTSGGGGSGLDMAFRIVGDASPVAEPRAGLLVGTVLAAVSLSRRCRWPRIAAPPRGQIAA
jgi:hypothetical protein